MKSINTKKIICVILVITLMFSLVSCGNAKEYKGKPGEGAVKVGVILQGSIDDAGFNQSCYEMCQALEKNIDGLTVLRKENVPETSEAETVMEAMIDQGCTIILATSFGYLESMKNCAARHPEVAFIHQGGTIAEENMSSVGGNFWESMYLCGIAAASVTQSKKLGFVAPYAIPMVIAAVNAFELGAQSVDPDITTNVVFIGSWSDAGLQTNSVNSMISQNVDVIAQFQDSTKTIIELCEKNHIYTVGFHVDEKQLAPDVWLTGSVNDWSVYVDMVKNIISGNYKSQSLRGGFKEGLIDLAEFGDSVDTETQNNLETIKEEMRDGTFNVFTGPVYDQNGNLVIEEGYSPTVEDVQGYNWLVKGVIGNID